MTPIFFSPDGQPILTVAPIWLAGCHQTWIQWRGRAPLLKALPHSSSSVSWSQNMLLDLIWFYLPLPCQSRGSICAGSRSSWPRTSLQRQQALSWSAWRWERCCPGSRRTRWQRPGSASYQRPAWTLLLRCRPAIWCEASNQRNFDLSEGHRLICHLPTSSSSKVSPTGGVPWEKVALTLARLWSQIHQVWPTLLLPAVDVDVGHLPIKLAGQAFIHKETQHHVALHICRLVNTDSSHLNVWPQNLAIPCNPDFFPNSVNLKADMLPNIDLNVFHTSQCEPKVVDHHIDQNLFGTLILPKSRSEPFFLVFPYYLIQKR